MIIIELLAAACFGQVQEFYKSVGCLKTIVQPSDIVFVARDDEKINWYARLGWQTIGTDTFKGYPVTVMAFDLKK
jgi:hypothetical protein